MASGPSLGLPPSHPPFTPPQASPPHTKGRKSENKQAQAQGKRHRPLQAGQVCICSGLGGGEGRGVVKCYMNNF